MINNIMRTVRLYGKMGSRFGRVHKLAVSSPAEAIKALCVTIPGFEKYLMDSKKNNLEFAVFNGKENISEELLKMGGTKDIRIAPIISGSKRNGLFQTILGAVMVVVGVVFPPVAFLIAPGVALMAGGIIQMLSPQPKGLKSRQDPDNAPSYAFGGAVNSTAQGNPISILAGERQIGGAIISASIVAEEYA